MFLASPTLLQIMSLIKALNPTAHMATQNATSEWTIVASPTQPFRFRLEQASPLDRQGEAKLGRVIRREAFVTDWSKAGEY
jgi:hypothetical protein